MRPTHRGLFRAATAATALALPLALASPAGADPDTGRQQQALKSIKAPNAMRHLQAFQKIADANGGTRASGTPGYAASKDYVAGKLKAAGYNVTIQPFQFPFFQENATSELQQTAPDATTYEPTPPDGSTLGDFATMTYSGSGEVTGTVQGVDLTLPPSPAPGSSSGCEATDFAGFTAGNIALLQRGTCDFEVKAANAQAAGATGAIIFNEGQEGRTDAFVGTLNRPFTIPVLGASFATGNDLASPAGTTVRMRTDTASEVRTTWNVLAESKKGRADKVVMSGAHLDAVLAGPGINDNGSGSAALLEVAVQIAKLPPKNKLRFAWWGAEELSLLGSEHYVATLPETERDRIGLYLNYDMVASPNHMFGIYDGDDSDATGAPAGPPGSDHIEKTFERYFDTLKLGHVGTDFTGRSDYGPFIAVGIPAGGLFTGAEGIKTEAEAALFGGTAGAPYDPCYHQACDDLSNINEKALQANMGAIGFTTLTYAYSRDLPGADAPATTKATAGTATGTGHQHGGLAR
ncbi:M28 family metallopeptidase [Actinomadura sp. 9N407]|uniref:M28 family metallopeptidase n=1 Tax=Actinomadura sp. 9N407 TaxID=3375154 RepID=UPI0037A305E0